MKQNIFLKYVMKGNDLRAYNNASTKEKLRKERKVKRIDR